MPHRQLIATMWTNAWSEGLWAASWSKSVEGLTPTQAAWNPPSAPGITGARHSIWQIVEHLIFWRESWLARLDGAPGPSADVLATRNFPAIRDPSAAAWDATRARFRQSQERIAAALANRGPEADPLAFFLPHDSYHVGQINLIRAMLGMPPIE